MSRQTPLVTGHVFTFFLLNVHVEINAAHTFDEGANKYPNVIETTIHVPDPRNKVTIDDSPAATD